MGDKTNSVTWQTWRVAKALAEAILAGDENRVWSPACITSLLAVAQEGSSGATRRELGELLGNGNLLVEHDPFGIEREGNRGYDGYDACSATAAWISRSANPSAEFLRKCDECRVRISIDDLGDPRVGQEVTSWISEQTRGLLTPVVELSVVALVCLVSALYLKDAWADPFERQLSEIGTFHAKAGDVQAAFMRGERDCAVIDGDGCTAFLVPLSSEANMLFALPSGEGSHMGEALDLFERLSHRKGEWEPVDLSIPRFECETTLSDLSSLLEAAGVSTASAMELAPMVGIESTPTQVVHGAKLVVNEEGMEAGAYAVMTAFAGLPPENPPEPRKITLDKPFYVAVASRSGAPLFMGSVALPSEDISVWHDDEIEDDSEA